MDRKGFTLIEILAVIAILAILILVVVPNVTGVFGKAKDKNFLSEAQAVYKAAKNQYVLDNANGDYGIVYQDGVNDYTGTDVRALDVTKRDGFGYVVKFNADGEIYYFKVFDQNFEIERGDLFDEASSVSLKDISMSSIVYKDGRRNEYPEVNSDSNKEPGNNTNPGGNSGGNSGGNNGNGRIEIDDTIQASVCTAGYYINPNGDCIICPQGTYSPAGATSCTYCPTGTTSPAGSTSSLACRPGEEITPIYPPEDTE